MGQLRDRMEQDLKLKGVSPATIRNYLLYCRKFAAFFMRSPEDLGAAEVSRLSAAPNRGGTTGLCQLPPGLRCPQVPLHRPPRPPRGSQSPAFPQAAAQRSTQGFDRRRTDRFLRGLA